MLAPRPTTQESTRRQGPARRVRAAISVDRATCGLVVGHLHVAKEHVVFVKGIVEASEGLACLFAERGGDLTIASPAGRRAELRELLVDLATDLGGLFDVAVDVDVDVELAHLADDADRSRNAADPASARSTTNAALDAGAPLRARAPR